MKCTCAHLGLYSHPKEFLGNAAVRTHVSYKGKIPSTGGLEEGGTRDAASRRTASPADYRLSYSGPGQSRKVVTPRENSVLESGQVDLNYCTVLLFQLSPWIASLA